jgi:rhodanese-related sulfurtransferase
MKKLAVVCSILMLAALIRAEPIEVTTSELADLVKAESVTLIDARPGAPAGLPGAKSLTGTPTAEEAAKVILSKDAPVVTYCGSVSCPLSAKMAKHLQSLGYTNVREYPEGFSGWKKAGHPVEALK